MDDVVPRSIWNYGDVGHTQQATNEIKELFSGEQVFDTPKPLKLLRRIVQLSSNKNDDIILDFFAGSGTTAHAIFEQNKEDGISRKSIIVQLPEVLLESNREQKAAYSFCMKNNLQPTISELTKIWSELQTEGYLEKSGKITKTLKEVLFENTFVISEKYASLQEQIETILRKSAGRLNINNADERKTIKYRKEVLNSPEFEALWQRICQKTLYRLAFDEEELIKSCTKSLSEMQPVAKAMVSFRKATIKQSQSGLDVKTLSNGTTSTVIDVAEQPLPDILGVLQEKTGLTRRSLSTILKESGRLADFAKNPQQFISEAIGRINYCKRLSIVDGIKYYPLKGEVYAQSLFMDKELTGYARNLFETSSKSVYEYVPKDSEVESRFAQELEEQDEVKLYVKLPGWFKIPTPLGTYNPDWALVIEDNGEEHIYFVVETKSKHIGLGNEEEAKITCGNAHFISLKDQISNPARYMRSTNINDVLNSI